MSEPTPNFPPWTAEVEQRVRADALENQNRVTSVQDVAGGWLALQSPTLGLATYMYDGPSVCPVMANGNGNGKSNGHANGHGSIVQVPYYDSKHGTLWWGDRLVKQLAHDAFNQRAFLEAAQRQGWPQPIETPLPVPERIDYRNVLHTTIQRLNDRKTMANPLLHFTRDGSGKNAHWQYLGTVTGPSGTPPNNGNGC